MIAENRQAIQLILNTAINMITHMYTILYICMHTYKHIIPNLRIISITILLLYISTNIILSSYVRNL